MRRTTELFTLVVAGTLVMGLTLPAQTPPPPPGGQGAGGPAAGPGRGRGDGRGGPQRDDPANVGVDFSKRNPVLPLKPEEELKHFVLQQGYRMELVLSDPVIDEPTAVTFDGNGRMFVLEDRAYMQNADATTRRTRSAASRCTRTSTTTASTRSTRCSWTSSSFRASSRRSVRTAC